MDLSASIETLKNTLVIFHVGLANVTKISELEIDAEEGDLLARSTVNVLEQYDIRPDPRIEAAIGLIAACATVYGPRLYLYRQRMAAEREAAKTPGTATVHNPDGSTGMTDFTTAPAPGPQI